MAYRRILFLLLFSAFARAGAVELGDARVSSYKGQPLVADIELSSLDAAAGAVQVRVANPDVYRGASIGVPPVLSALTLSVVQKGGKQFVHVTSSRPVDTDMLHLFLELGQGGGRDVRLASLALAADPHPAPPPPPAPVAVITPVIAPAVLPTTLPVPLPATQVAAPAPLHLAAVNTALPASVRAPASASCKASSPNNACVVLDKKNVALQAKLAGLENQVKLLEAAMAPAKAEEPPPPAPVVPAIAPVKPAPAPVPVLVTPKKPRPAPPPPSATPWLWIGVAAVVALAALGAIVFLLLRRRKAAPAASTGPGFMSSIKTRLKRNKAPAAEPALET